MVNITLLSLTPSLPRRNGKNNIEFGDAFGGQSLRYSQASTYGQLGLLAEAQEDYTEARTNLQKALKIYIEYKDEYWGNITRENLERLPE